ncbi:MAG TPA: ABC transporter ATP-binding protein [bacterium (Candidatus Stahlbacteria)]|nr:ABC transporter ATP-binding protein [Candidatus Stahlbacteria bacterium]
MIKIVNLRKAFSENKVLKGVFLEVKDGETTVIIGRSGCGKSVLLKHIIGLLRPDEGSVIIDGVEISKAFGKLLYETRRKIGVVFQEAALLDSLTVRENVGLGLRENTKLSKREIDDIVREKLNLVGLKGVEDLMPQHLSGGMKKRVGIARALAMNPKYVLYDEPTTALDPITSRRINNLIRDLQERLSITTIAVTHDLETAYRIGDKIAMLNDGKIVFEGTPEAIRETANPLIRNFIGGNDE